MPWKLLLIALTIAPCFAQESTKLTLNDALNRLQRAKVSIEQDRALLRAYRGRMSSEKLTTFKLRVDRREAKVKEMERRFQEQLAQLEKERQIRASTGKEFYEQQAKYYEPILRSDLDLVNH